MTEETYKVLWIDDDTSIVDNYTRRAEKHNLAMNHFTNWKDAYAELERNFEEYSAIILDAICKRDPDDIAHKDFLMEAIAQLNSLMGRKQRDIPWYILSAFRDQFKSKYESLERLRKNNTEEWGPMEYSKMASTGAENHMDNLFENIRRVAQQKGLNIALNRHAKIFNFMGEGKLIHYEARKLMLRMLGALYFPEENITFQYEANPLRKILEYFFRAARDKGLVPTECFEDGIHLNAASRYMAGLNPSKGVGKRYGIAGMGKDGRDGDAIFSPEISQIVWNLLTYTNGGSHIEEEPKEEPYVISEESKELFFGYVLQLCHVIKWFGRYVERHPNKVDNLSMEREFKGNATPTVASPDDVLRKEYLVLNRGKFYSAGLCKLSLDCKKQTKPSDTVRIVNVKKNFKADKSSYPYIATEIEKIETI